MKNYLKVIVGALLMVVGMAVPASAQLGSVPYSFSAGTTIRSAEMNSNFSTAYANSLNRTGGTMTGTLTTLGVVPTATNASDLGSSSLFYRSIYARTSVVLGQTTANYTLTWANPAAARAISIADPGGTDVFTFNAASQTLTNKSISLGSNTLTATSAQLITAVSDETGSGVLVFGTTPTITTPVFSGTVTGTYTLGGTPTITSPVIATINSDLSVTGTIESADATTPILSTATGKTNTGYLSLTGKTSGSLKLLPADAMAQIVTIAGAAQTVGAATLTIPDQAGVSSDFVFTTLAQTLTNKTISGPSVTVTGNVSAEDLLIEDSNASHYLTITTTTDLTAGHTLTLVPGDADRTLTLSGNPTLSDWFNQSVKTTAAPTFAGGTYTWITGTGALISGSIGSGFGQINIGAQSITSGAITSSGLIKSTAAVGFKVAPTTATNYAFSEFTNTGGSSDIGMDDSTGSFLGAGNYAFGIWTQSASGVVIKAVNANGPFRVWTGNVEYLTLSSAGLLTLPGTLSVTGNVTFSGTGNAVGTITSGVWNAGAVTSSGVLTVNGFGAHVFSAGSTGENYLKVANTTDGTGNNATLYINAGTTATEIYSLPQSYTTSTWLVQAGTAIRGSGAGGMSIAATNASGDIRLYAGGTTIKAKLEASTGDFYTNDGSVSSLSDGRSKNRVGAFSPGLMAIHQIVKDLSMWQHKPEIAPDLPHSPIPFAGVRAQIVQPYIPEAVTEGADGFLRLKTGPIFWAGMRAITEVSDHVDAQEARITALEAALLKLHTP